MGMKVREKIKGPGGSGARTTAANRPKGAGHRYLFFIVTFEMAYHLSGRSPAIAIST
jgi:hypothetical protein